MTKVSNPFKPKTYARRGLKWRGLVLFLGERALAEIVRDSTYPATMWRFRLLPEGELSDMVNLTRVQDAAAAHAVARLNGKDAAETHRRVPTGRGPGGRYIPRV